MTKDATVIEGNVIKAIPVGEHKSCRLTIDIPEERGQWFITNFGFPTSSNPIPVAIARLVSTNAEKPKGGPLAKKAGIVCGEAAFKVFLEHDGQVISDVAAYLRAVCDIDSRAELDHNPEAAAKFRKLMDEYEMWLARPDLVG